MAAGSAAMPRLVEQKVFHSMRSSIMIRRILAAALALAATTAGPVLAFSAPRKQQAKKQRAAGDTSPRLVAEKTGSIPTREGLRLRVVTDLGDVFIRTVDSTPSSATVVYKIRIETDTKDAAAQQLIHQFSLAASSNSGGVQLTGQVPWHGFHGRLWVAYEVTVPRRFNLDVTTQVGNIETQDVDGRVSLVTLGGNITAGRIGGPEGSVPKLRDPASLPGTPTARLETQGGHITVQDVNGDLRAITAGGHINAGNVQGDAVLHTGGGNIRAGTIQGVAQLETGGGNVSVQRAGGGVTATSAGGQIDFGEAAGSIRARTAGGSIRVLRVSGPMQLASIGGSILLTQVRGGVHATTGAGNITAWFAPEPAMAGFMTPAVAPPASTPPAPPAGAAAPPALRSGAIAKVPLRPGIASAPGALMAAPARAGWKLVGASQLEAAQGDIVVYIPRELAVTIEAVVELGGENRIEADSDLPLKVKYVDSGSGTKQVHGECTMNGGGDVLRLKTTSGNIRVKLADTAGQEAFYKQQIGQIQRHLALAQQRLYEQLSAEQKKTSQEMQQRVQQQLQQAQQELAAAQAARESAAPQAARNSVRTFVWNWPWPDFFSGAVHVTAEEQQKRLISTVSPAYPAIAREAGIEGTVRLRVLIDKDGVVQEVHLVGGPPSLAVAAQSAVKQWRYQPAVVDGKPVSVITTVAIQFKIE